MKTSILFLSLFTAFLSGCKPDIPPIVFTVEKVEKLPFGSSKKDSLLYLTLSTKEDLAEIYKKSKAVNMYMYCPLKSGKFPVEDLGKEKYTLSNYGSMEKDSLKKYLEKNMLTFPIHFEDKDYPHLISKEKLENLLNAKKCIECQIVIACGIGSLKQITIQKHFAFP